MKGFNILTSVVKAFVFFFYSFFLEKALLCVVFLLLSWTEFTFQQNV